MLIAPVTIRTCVILLIASASLFSVTYAEAQPTKNKTGNVEITPAIKSIYNEADKPIWQGERFNCLPAFLNLLDTAGKYGLRKEKYHYASLKTKLAVTSASNLSLNDDRIFTDAIFNFYFDLWHGDVSGYFNYDELSYKVVATENAFIASKVRELQSPEDVAQLIRILEPDSPVYDQLKAALAPGWSKQLAWSLNQLRYILHYKFPRFIVVNIPSADLTLYQQDTVALNMKVVVGKPATKTPRFTAWSNSVVLYPYWYVPNSIAIKEYLPMFRRNPGLISAMHLQVLNGAGKVISPGSVNWSSVSANNFPYKFRQSTGCDNSLGILKFNLTDPYNIYMHDTNYKLAFAFPKRFFSHGCIRLEKPFELADILLPGVINNEFLTACLKDQQPVEIKIEQPVPVFVVYMTAEILNGKIKYWPDVYQLAR